ncbi:MAG TPA: Calx-beta domain-containing protein [Planctomycetota bacterium]|nr:Calx-beta domain-containing protein [Planctomycetota bacterium]
MRRSTTAVVSALLTLLLLSASAEAAWTNAPGSPYALPAGSGPQLLTIGDFNNDSFPDIIAANSTGGTVTVLFGDGTGLFGGAQTFAAGGTPIDVITADLNRDGKLDIITANFITPGTITILYGNGSGGVSQTRTYAAGTKPLGVISHDYNRDGRPDLAFTTPTDVNVWLGDGAGNFTPAPGTPFATRGSYPEFLCSADLNNDGLLDMAVTNFHSGNASIFFGDGAGRFSEIAGSPYAIGPGTTQIRPGDFNADGRIDIAVNSQNSNSLGVLMNLGGGNFSTAGTGSPIIVGNKPVTMAVGDYDGDGKLDIVTSSLDTGQIALVGGNGDGTFRAPAIMNIGLKCPGVATGQLNGGGLPDLAIADVRGNQIFALNNSADANGPGLFRFGAASYSVNESGGFIDVTVLRVSGNTEAASVTVQSSDGSADSPDDFTSVFQRIDLQPGDISRTVRIPVVRDSWYEGAETFDLILSAPSNGAGLTTPSSSRVTIQDAQSPPHITWDASTYSINETAGSLTVHARMSVPAQRATTVNISAANGTASSGSDYDFAPRTLAFDPGETDLPAVLNIFTDGIYEGDEDLKLRFSSPTNSATVASPSTVTIQDAQSPGVIAFSLASYEIGEAATTLDVELTLSVPAQRDAFVDFAAVNREARNGFDYAVSDQRVRFASLETRKTVSITIRPDSVYEGNETFALNLSNVSGSAVLGAQTDAIATIIDAQAPGSFSFSAAHIDTLANPGDVTFKVTLSQASENAMAVTYQARGDTAAVGIDFAAASGTLVFPGGATEQTITLNILKRDDRRGDERFTLALSAPTLGAKLGPIDTATVAIITPAVLPPAVSTSIVIGEPVRFDLPVRGSAPITVTTGALPPGLSFDGSAITGVATDIGVYSIDVSATNPWAVTSSTLTLLVLPRPQGGASLTTLDSDGDGFPDELEDALGTRPGSSASSPGSAQFQKLTTAQLSVKLAPKSGSDSLSFTAALPAGTAPAAQFIADIGGVIQKVNATSRTRGLSFRMAAQKRGGSGQKMSLKLSKGTFANALRDEGLRDENASGKNVEIPIVILWNDQAFIATIQGTYSSKQGRGGKFSGAAR